MASRAPRSSHLDGPCPCLMIGPESFASRRISAVGRPSGYDFSAPAWTFSAAKNILRLMNPRGVSLVFTCSHVNKMDRGSSLRMIDSRWFRHVQPAHYAD